MFEPALLFKLLLEGALNVNDAETSLLFAGARFPVEPEVLLLLLKLNKDGAELLLVLLFTALALLLNENIPPAAGAVWG